MNEFAKPIAGDKEDHYRSRVVTVAQAIVLFVRWSMRRRSGQFLPITVAFLLFVGTVQAVGTFHDISSSLTQQKIAQNWRGPYDLLVRPQFAVSQPERSADWVDPQSMLESYGGISAQQVASIRSLSHVALVAPIANSGWQSIAVQLPVELPSRGIYRVAAIWKGQERAESTIVSYVDVTDLAHLTAGIPAMRPPLVYVIAKDDRTPVAYSLQVQAAQEVIGVPSEQRALLSKVLLEDIVPTAPAHFTLQVDKLLGDFAMLPACLQRADCWAPLPVRQGTIRYQVDSVQLLRYSRTHYSGSPQQLAAGQLTVLSLGEDMQGSLYRTQLSAQVVFDGGNADAEGVSPRLMPLNQTERLPLLEGAVRFISLEQACSLIGSNCFSGVYVRLQGVEQYNQRSLALLQATAATITAHTGLHVDILDGSSVRAVAIVSSSPYASHVFRSSWRVLGVAVQLVQGVDALQELLLALCTFVSLLAIGAAAVLVGSGRRKEALLLQRLGWRSNLLFCLFCFEALLLCFPGYGLAVAWMVVSTTFWHNHLPIGTVALLLSLGVSIYCCMLASIACYRSTGDRKQRAQYISKKGKEENRVGKTAGRSALWDALTPQVGAMNCSPTLKCIEQRAARFYRGRDPLVGALPTFACSIAISAVVFLIAVDALFLIGFNHELVVTVLGEQVREVLEAPQIILLLLILLAAQLTVGLCMTLLLQGRRAELSLLSWVGWERPAVIWRLLWDSWRPALFSGEVGVLLAVAASSIGGVLPTPFVIGAMFVGGPLVGVLLVSMATMGPAWHETKRVYSWR